MKKLVAGLALLVALFIPAGTFAKDYAELYRPTTVEKLFEQAILHGGYKERCDKEGCPMPSVRIIPLGENVLGQFRPTQVPGEVLIATELPPGNMLWNEVVVHEFVHYLQWRFAELTPTLTYCGLAKLEAAAYAAGIAYLKQFGIAADHSEQIAMVNFNCLASGGR